MEVLVCGLTALIAHYNKRARIVPEPAEFESFDVRTLGHVYDLRENARRGTTDWASPDL